MAAIDTRGASGAVGTGGGSITITAGSAFGLATVINGTLLAGGGTQGATALPRTPGSAIRINANTFSGPTRLLGEVRTNDGSIDIGGEGLEAHAAITTAVSAR